MRCPNCGGTMIGDGYSEVMHCENSRYEDWEGMEADSSPIFCNFSEESKETIKPNYDSSYGERIEDLEAALIDLAEGKDWADIHAWTGLSVGRCREIENLYREVNKRYLERHGLK